MLLKILIFFIITTTVPIIIVSSEEVTEKKIESPKEVVFPMEEILKENLPNEDNSENPTPRESKDMKFLPNHFHGRSANPVGDNFESDEYDDDDDDDEEIDNDENFDYRNMGRSEIIEPIQMNRNLNRNIGNRRSSGGISGNTKNVVPDNPRIYTLRDGINIFRNFWRNRNAPKIEEPVPVITLTTSPTAATATATAPEAQSEDFGTVTGTATGTGTMTAASPDEIAQNNAAAQTIETPSPFFSFSRREPIEYEILEEESDSNAENDNSNVFFLNSDYIDISDDENQSGKSQISTMISPMQQIQKQNLSQQQQSLQPQQLPKRKNTKQPIKVLNEAVALANEKPKVVQEVVPKTGLEYYRQYLPNLRKLIEIRPKFFLNRMSPKHEMNDNAGSQRNLQKNTAKRSNYRLNTRAHKKPVPNIVGFIESDQTSNTNRLPVKRVQLYLV